jgi:NitT/TauT family transport system substrate-binding protein
MFGLARSVAASVVVAGVVLLSTTAMAAEKVTIGYTAANDFLAAFVAKDQGFFEKRGLDVTLTRIANGSTLPAAMIGGSVTVGTITPPLLLQANDNGLGLKMLAAASIQSSKNPTVGVVVRNGTTISSPADFIGKKVGAPGLNSVLHVMFVRWLRGKGVDSTKVTFIEGGFAQFGDLMRGGQIDAALLVEPFRSRIEQGGIGKNYANFFSEVRDNTLLSFYAVTTDWASKKPEAAKAFQEALNDAVAFIRANEAEARKSQAQYLGLPPEVVATLPLATYTSKIEPDDVRFWIEVCRELGMVTKPVNTADLVVN